VIVGRVVGSLWSADQDPGFDGLVLKLVVPEDARTREASGNTMVVVDLVGSRTGDTVLVVYEGSASRMCMGRDKSSAEAIIIGIVDEMNVVGGE
jgi:microcompartment protein CcmK/EutM